MGSILCKIVPFAADVSTIVSILSMLTIAAERFRAVVYPAKPARFCVSSRRRLIALIWVITLIAHCVYFSVIITVDIADKTYCVPIYHPFETIQIYFICGMVFLVAIPTILLFVLYTAIIKTLRRQEEQVASHFMDIWGLKHYDGERRRTEKSQLC